MFTSKQIFSIILPLLLQQFFLIFGGFADTVMVASVGEAAIAGVSLVDQLSAILTTTMAALASGSAVLCAQSLGRKDIDGAASYAKQLLLSNLIIALVLMLVLIVFNRSILTLVFGNIEPEVMDNACKYLVVIAVSIPFFAIDNALAAVFRAEGNTHISFNISLITTVIHLVGNAIGIYVLHAGVYGVAIPTLISRIASVALYYYAVKHSKGQIKVNFKSDNRLHFGKLKQIYALGIPMGVENFMFQFGRTMLSSLTVSLGTTSVAAYAASLKICNFAYLPGQALALAVPAIVGRCIGAGEYGLAKKNAYRLFGYKYAIMLPVVLVISIFAPQIAGWFNLSESGIGFCTAMVLVNSAIMPIRPFAFQMGYVLQSASDVRYTMTVSMISMWIFRVGCAYLFVNVFHTGVVGIYYGLALDWVVRATLYAWRFFSGKWLRVYQRKQQALETAKN